MQACGKYAGPVVVTLCPFHHLKNWSLDWGKTLRNRTPSQLGAHQGAQSSEIMWEKVTRQAVSGVGAFWQTRLNFLLSDLQPFGSIVFRNVHQKHFFKSLERFCNIRWQLNCAFVYYLTLNAKVTEGVLVFISSGCDPNLCISVSQAVSFVGRWQINCVEFGLFALMKNVMV